MSNTLSFAMVIDAMLKCGWVANVLGVAKTQDQDDSRHGQ
jgi:hypothetical protein